MRLAQLLEHLRACGCTFGKPLPDCDHQVVRRGDRVTIISTHDRANPLGTALLRKVALDLEIQD